MRNKRHDKKSTGKISDRKNRRVREKIKTEDFTTEIKMTKKFKKQIIKYNLLNCQLIQIQEQY